MRYATAPNFRTALEERIRQIAGRDGFAIQRIRKRVAFERFLARIQAPPDSPWFLKGAFALDLRFADRSRTTRDLDLGIDLSLMSDPTIAAAEIVHRLREGGGHQLQDFFVFSVPGEGEEILQEPGTHAYRFTVRASLADRPFEDFRVDVGAGLQLVTPVEEIPESDTLAFSGIVPRRFRAISLAQQLAEKVHAMTRPWEDRENTRVKDLVDITLILESSPPEPKMARIALERIFEGRDTHRLPTVIPDPPPTWPGSYRALASEIG
ncbi:MAG: nucleotidyl transferase AbiEii/AbiGii toxin family protein, partial [Candidatus Methylomirabilis sp.]